VACIAVNAGRVVESGTSASGKMRVSTKPPSLNDLTASRRAAFVPA